ncbi:MAG: DUF3737 family protein [Candidatus Coproplasma sp.]
MDKIIKDTSFDEERALYASENLTLINVRFDGTADGESAIKECTNVTVKDCYFNLRYPMWHVRGLKIEASHLTENCRAAVWYTDGAEINNSTLFGIKAVRECKDVALSNCTIISPEFGWFTNGIEIESCQITSEYFLLKSSQINLKNTVFNGKYSFQYVQGGTIENCTLNTKDAFWHAKGLHIKNCKVYGEYLGWYSQDLVFENCEIQGTQPLCYCKNLTLINCSMQGCDLSFEKSEVFAAITTKIDSIKNPYGGQISAPDVGEVIVDDQLAKAEIVTPKGILK